MTPPSAMGFPSDQPLKSSSGEPQRRSGRYRYHGGKPADPNEGVHPEMVDSDPSEPPATGIPGSPDELIAMQARSERPEKPDRELSARVQEVLDLIEQLDISTAEDQQIALTLVRHLEGFHDEVVEEMKADEQAKHSQIVAWSIDADRLMRSRILLESVDLE
ncbi:hypothetical protein [Synechococcus sp. CCY9202]|uniref:hypothetical protein n=1 Tax=Synechococcus sp. CCY9202 TaxID=174698 RepID=UPI002B21653B|nr:hypothetical protein [Synechococcus sp. CCY9202]MEA5421848.1 hypothetical protein [Synechococcus sp. CCY9202]